MRRMVLGVLFLLGVAAAQAQTPGAWVKLAPFPEPSAELDGAMAGGKMYVFSGLAPGFKPKALVYEYDPATDRWAKKKPMPLMESHVAFAEFNGKIYAFGGFVPPPSREAAFIPVDNAWQYDPAADSWKALAPMPSKRGGVVTAVAGGKIYVIGGATLQTGSSETMLSPMRPQRTLPTVEEYDPSTNAWRVRSPMPTARALPVAGTVDGKIYVIGGRLGSIFMSVASNTDIVEQYDPTTDSWGVARAPMPTSRSGCAWGTYGGKIYVAGGENENTQVSAVFRTLEAYDPATNRWASLPSMPVGRFALAGAILGNRLHLVSGSVQPGADIPTESPSHNAFELPGM